MKKSFSFNNYTFQFILLVIISFAFGSILFLTVKNLNLMEAPADAPLGAEDSFIVYNNFFKSLCAIVVIHFYKLYGEPRIRNKIFEYVLFAVAIYVGAGFINFAVQAVIQNAADFLTIFWSPGGVVIFRLNIVFAALLVYYWSKLEEKKDLEILHGKLELSTLQTLKAKAELEALQAKINPHFLYNSLNSINSLVDQNPTKAKEMILLLSKLFRLSVNSKNDLHASLQEEIELVTNYLSIEKIRFGERLQFNIDCESALINEHIPKFLIQPLVENAVIHGTSKLSTVGKINVKISNEQDFLVFAVSDNGPSFSPDFQPGYGLQSIYDKIKLLGGKDASFQIVDVRKDVQDEFKYIVVKVRKGESYNR